MLMLRVVRFRRRAPRCASSAWTVRETLAAGRRNASAALEKLPLSTTRTKTFIARKRSMPGVLLARRCQVSGFLLLRGPKGGYYDGLGGFCLDGASGGWGVWSGGVDAGGGQVLGLTVGVSAGVPGSCVSGRIQCRVARFLR